MSFFRNFFDFVSEHRTAALVSCIVIIVIATIVSVRIAFRTGLDMPAAYPVWFYDETTEKLFVGTSHDIPPIKPPSSNTAADGRPAGVRAYVYGCSRCDEVGRVIVYLERFTEDAQEASLEMMKARARGETNRFRELQARVDAGREVRGTYDQSWSRADRVVVEAMGEQGAVTYLGQLMNAFAETCEEHDATPQPCTPE